MNPRRARFVRPSRCTSRISRHPVINVWLTVPDVTGYAVKSQMDRNSMPSNRPKRKAIPKRVKVLVRLLQNGLCGCRKKCGAKSPPDGLGLVDLQHEPPLALREVNEAGTDYIPAQHDPNFLYAELKACHREESYHPRSKATSIGSDRHAIDKTRRLRGELKPKRKKAWPRGRKLQSRGFQRSK